MKKLDRILCVTSNFPRWSGDSTTPFVLHLAEDLRDFPLMRSRSSRICRTTRIEKTANTSLVLHSDNGSPMKSFTMRAKMYELDVIPSHSRPRVSNDNPFSESIFRTVKYCPSWPKQGFLNIGEARKWVARFVAWYNNEHRHSQIKFVTPNQRHSGQDIKILQQRKVLYEMKKQANTSRWSGATRNWEPVDAVCLNPDEVKIAA